jgi:3-oxoacyl-[acyl-carrier protein] reductase
MDLQLHDKRALVTGSSSGIGAGIARILAAEGAQVVVHGRDEERANRVAAEIRASGGRAEVALGDLSDDEGAAYITEVVLSTLGGVDILINNAGGRTTNGNPPWLDIGLEDWRATYEQNVGAAVRMVRAFAPGMQERRWGRIIQIASAAATQTEPDLGEYQAAKAALVNVTSSLAKTFAHTGITVNTVSPGMVLTPAAHVWMTSVANERGWGEDFEEIERRFTREVIPLSVARIGRPEDIGRLIAFLASPLSAYVTGANFRIDGGQCRSVN